MSRRKGEITRAEIDRRRGEADAVRWCFRLASDAERFREQFGGQTRDVRSEIAARKARRVVKSSHP